MKNQLGKAIGVAVFGLSLIVIMAALLSPTKADPRDQYHAGWKLVFETADGDYNDFASTYDLTTEGNFANKDSSTVANGGPFWIRSYAGGGAGTEFQSSGEKWMFAICGKNYNNTDDTFSFNIIGWSRINGMLQTIVEGDGVLGTQAVIVYPDGGDAVGELVSESDIVYTHATTQFDGDASEFDGVVVGMMAYVTTDNDSNLTSGYYPVTTYTDVNTIKCSGASSSSDTTCTVEINPAFWADTINLDETTKWPRDGDSNNIVVYNSSDNEVAFIVIETTGLEWIQFVIYDCDAATSEEAGAITVYGRPF